MGTAVEPDAALEERVERLERQLANERIRNTRTSLAAAGFAVGAMAVVVALGLPWLSESRPGLTAPLYDEPWGTSATGWRMLRWGLANPDANYASVTALALLLPIAAALTALFALVRRSPGSGEGAAIVAVCALIGQVLLIEGHITDGSIDGEVATAPGMYIAGIACLAILAAGVVQSRLRRLAE